MTLILKILFHKNLPLRQQHQQVAWCRVPGFRRHTWKAYPFCNSRMQLRSARVAASRIQVLPSDWVNQSPDKQTRQKTILANVYFSRDVCSRFTVECGFKTITVFALRRLLCELKSHEHNNGTTFDSLSDLRQSSGLGKFSELTAALARKIRPKRKTDSVWIPTYSNTHRREMKRENAWIEKSEETAFLGKSHLFCQTHHWRKTTEESCAMEFQLQGSKFLKFWTYFETSHRALQYLPWKVQPQRTKGVRS